MLPEHGDPAEIAVARDTIRLAFITALQHLPARQRATLILCEVLRMPAAEAAATLGTSVPAVNSALQRARATLAALPEEQRPTSVDADQSDLLARYVDAFQRYDMEQLVTLLHDDALMTMPPFAMWVRGAAERLPLDDRSRRRACARAPSWCPRARSTASRRGRSTSRTRTAGIQPWALQVHEVSGGRVSRLTFFLDTERIFPAFGLPSHLS